MAFPHPPGITRPCPLLELVGPAIPQALLLARYQASRYVDEDIVEVSENDAINRKPSPEEERIMTSNASVVSALEDLFSWIHKDRSSRTSRLSFVESWRFHRAMYRVWSLLTLLGYGIPLRKPPAKDPSVETQKAFLSKLTSQELVQINKILGFLKDIIRWVTVSEQTPAQFFDEFDITGLHLFAGPHIILRCFDEKSSRPLAFVYRDDVRDGSYEDFLLPAVETILSQNNVTIPRAFVGSILDDVCGAHSTCRACGKSGHGLYTPPGTQCTPNLYSEKNWGYLKGNLGVFNFFALASNVVERPLFKTLREADYESLLHELFTYKDEPFQDWTPQDWICLPCLRTFFVPTVFRWWRARKVQGGVLVLISLIASGLTFGQARESIPKDCKHGYYCMDQYREAGRDHATRFNHACMPVDNAISQAHYYSRNLE